ncbi:putative Annexin superfamily [Dioscorea sansibarensis]
MFAGKSGRQRNEGLEVDQAVVAKDAKHLFKAGEKRSVINSDTSGNFEFALLTILRCAETPGEYFAKVLFFLDCNVMQVLTEILVWFLFLFISLL